MNFPILPRWVFALFAVAALCGIPTGGWAHADPAAPSVLGSPQADQALTDALPKSLPELAQDIVDPAYDFLILGEQLPPMTMDTEAPLAEQLKATSDLVAATPVAPDLTVCGDTTTYSKAACALGIIQRYKSEPGPLTDVYLIGRYGFLIRQDCTGDALDFQYCAQTVMASETRMDHDLTADPGNADLGEWVAGLGHEIGHAERAVMIGGDIAFARYLRQSPANVRLEEKIADIEAGRIIQRALNDGLLTTEQGEAGTDLFGRIGRDREGTPSEVAHGSGTERDAAVREGRRQASEEAATGIRLPLAA